MKERPILFSGPMVRAILEGRKTQTRRVVKGELAGIDPATYQPFAVRSLRWCPYGQPGDRLWVRESFQPLLADGVKPSGCNYKTGEGYEVFYPATDPVQEFDDLNDEGTLSSRVWPSIHMPRWASRITLEVTEVRVERVADIGANDAWAEGVSCYNDFKALWDSINGQRPGCDWASNPWVWAVSFKRVEVKP